MINVLIVARVNVGSNCFCAENIAIGSMMTNGEYKIQKIVAVWKNKEGKVFVIPPCGKRIVTLSWLEEKTEVRS